MKEGAKKLVDETTTRVKDEQEKEFALCLQQLKEDIDWEVSKYQNEVETLTKTGAITATKNENLHSQVMELEQLAKEREQAT